MRAALFVLVSAAAGCLDRPPASEWVPLADVPGAHAATAPAPAPPDDRLRITTFNVELGRDLDALAAALEADPELAATSVLLVQEIEDHPDEPAPRAARLADRLGMSYAYAPARALDGGGTHGLAILSRHELGAVEVMQLPYYDLHVNARTRIALAADVAGVRIVNVHLDTRLNITERVIQLDPVVATSPSTAVVAGDFNTNPYAWVDGTVPLPGVDAAADADQAELLDDYMAANGFDTPTADSGPTQDAGVVSLRLDSIYTRALSVTDTGVVRGLGVSDHDPLWVDIRAP